MIDFASGDYYVCVCHPTTWAGLKGEVARDFWKRTHRYLRLLTHGFPAEYLDDTEDDPDFRWPDPELGTWEGVRFVER